ncbi:MAG TPA: kelch repeat-containing protein [Micromonospora sp.]|nr:kelch repeat-containing protein [Micromonospora sp.]
MDNAVASFDGKVCSLGGGDGSSTYANSYVYDVAANTWTRIADLPLPVNGASAAVIDGLVYVFGGWGSTGSPSARAQV